MNEEERAERFARALDDFLSGAANEPPPSLDDHDLTSLFDVASRRVARSENAREQARQYEADVWERLIDRLGDPGDVEDDAGLGPDPDARQMMDVISMRRSISEDALALAEQHRRDVWDKIQQRLAEDNGHRAPLVISHDTDDLPAYESGDPQFDSLVRISLSAAHAPPRDPEMTVRLWARVGGFPDHSDLEKSLDERWNKADIPASILAKALGIAAGVALFIAAVGPLPTTGFADHPLVEGAEHLAGATGVIESDNPPQAPAARTVDDGSAVTTSEASRSMGLQVAEPAYVPPHFSLVSSTLHETGITGPEGGVFSLVYESRAGESSLAIYQEPARGPAIAAGRGSTTDTVVKGSPATYFEGGWRSESESLTWAQGESQSLVFEREGLRTLIHYSGPRINAVELLSVADSMQAN